MIDEEVVPAAVQAIPGRVTRTPAGTGSRPTWLLPVMALATFSMLVFAGLYTLDGGVSARYLDFDPQLVTDALPALGMTLVAVLGIVLTVVAIIVQLSSDRYTGVAMMFMRDRINISVMAYFVVASVCAIWLSVSLQEGFVPVTTIVFMMAAASVGLALMLPYFFYVFWFLEPGNIVSRIRGNADRMIDRAIRSGSPVACDRLQPKVVNALEEITDIANNSIDGKDKIITSHAVNALRDFAVMYIAGKPAADHAWYRISEAVRKNPDFVAMDPESLHELELRWMWLEWKVLRQYLGIYNEALGSMRDINYLIAIDTRYIGEAAANTGDLELLRMVFRFMNSYLRAAINARSVRTAYNVLHQYRKLVESVLKAGHGDIAHEAVRFLKYYGHVSFEQKLTFVTETIAYDIASLCQYTHDLGMPEEPRMLEQFLELDQPTRAYSQERGLRGVRKAQAKLATYYLSVGDRGKANMIAEDMLTEPADLLHLIHKDLEQADTGTYWEIVDRGRNFEYLPPLQREQLAAFFGMLAEAPPPRRRANDA